IGSNSVRLVIYRLGKRGHDIIEEKKAVCGLARGMGHDRPYLDAKGMAKTLKALRKFRRVIAQCQPRTVLAIGTAAMRAVERTKQGRAFHKKAERALGAKIAVISGIKEARLTAKGVMASLPRAKGICGDLGGGSLELAAIRRGRIGHTATLPLGSLTLIHETGGDALEAEAIMRARLGGLPWLGRHKGGTFYPIGGSWRAVARVMMSIRHRKPRSVHGYAISATAARKLAAFIAGQKPAAFRAMQKKVRQRADVVPFAAAVLVEIIARMRPARIVFSGHGVREGLVREYRVRSGI
ncbi:MAG TPA: hypothetical protein VMV79_00545, partial [Alphaproteobacteria bacterium]|nr:hypothetical protein [Alphaproteobacteria bacterium]